ncbi:hypothetical protein E4U42_001410 [Claviceps africana]|uniref:Uncharacterized protein n=1 Tax=Claviceps africana TaxID=83212 RepID=A0A8K0NI24_9HYPO|nr:hypothetical protein E4U42_001410 [Claviceps africana]
MNIKASVVHSMAGGQQIELTAARDMPPFHCIQQVIADQVTGFVCHRVHFTRGCSCRPPNHDPVQGFQRNLFDFSPEIRDSFMPFLGALIGFPSNFGPSPLRLQASGIRPKASTAAIAATCSSAGPLASKMTI